ncbi:MAG: pirin family protein [Alphaproteobacteria bacterium]|nr:pirin family protein [Alphaproteobacteria bacterium]
MSGARGVSPNIVLAPRARDIGSFEVRRVLPDGKRRTVGPFVFFDHMGPARFAAGQGVDVRPHPHIGLATLTWLFEGEIMHHDSLGTAQPIRPGEVNWMTAGRGIVHSERTPEAIRAKASGLAGIQAWIGLPRANEECPPAFSYHSSGELPGFEEGGVALRLVGGTLRGLRSPVPVYSPLLFAEALLAAGAALVVPPEHAECALHVAEGAIDCGGQHIEAGAMAVFPAGGDVVATADGPATVILIGGEPLDGERHLWWNFVSSSRERIEQAKADWREGRFAMVEGDPEFIPLPER